MTNIWLQFFFSIFKSFSKVLHIKNITLYYYKAKCSFQNAQETYNAKDVIGLIIDLKKLLSQKTCLKRDKNINEYMCGNQQMFLTHCVIQYVPFTLNNLTYFTSLPL